MKCATASARKLFAREQADREAAGLRLLSSAVNYLQRTYWRASHRDGRWGWQTEAHAAAFGILVSASFRLQADKMKRHPGLDGHLLRRRLLDLRDRARLPPRGADPMTAAVVNQRRARRGPAARSEICKRCGQGFTEVWWCPDEELYVALVGDARKNWCIECFSEIALERGIVLYWQPSRRLRGKKGGRR